MISEAKDHFYRAVDNLRLRYREFKPADDTDATPVVCLPGLTRSAVDFDSLAGALAADPRCPRRVVAFDYRGRGLSDHDPDWHHYDMATERRDVLDGLAVCGIHHAHFIGTSRGGLHIMALAATHRPMIRGVILNDIGPVLEPGGLKRIKSYVGAMVAPRTMKEAVHVLKLGAGEHFDGLSPEEWRIFATTTFGADESNMRLRYDPNLARTLDGFDLDRPLPDSWHLFDALRGAPLLVIRGANSDLLSEATLASMGQRWAHVVTMTVPGQGHAPLLADPSSIGHVQDFLLKADCF